MKKILTQKNKKTFWIVVMIAILGWALYEIWQRYFGKSEKPAAPNTTTGSTANYGSGTAPATTALLAPTGLNSGNLTATSATINWIAVPTATYYIIQRSVSASSGFAAIGTATNATTYIDTTVTANTTYYYRVLASNATGNSPESASLTVVVPPIAVATPVPDQVTGLALTKNGTKITANWAANTTGSTPTGYRVEVSTDNSTWTTLLNVPNTTFEHVALTNGTTYYYRISAFNATGSATPSAVSSATITAAATLPVPPVPALGAGSHAQGNNSSLTLNWTYPSTAPAVTKFNVLRADATGPYANVFSWTSPDISPNDRSYTTVGLQQGVAHVFKVVATNATGSTESAVVNMSATYLD